MVDTTFSVLCLENLMCNTDEANGSCVPNFTCNLLNIYPPHRVYENKANKKNYRNLCGILTKPNFSKRVRKKNKMEGQM